MKNEKRMTKYGIVISSIKLYFLVFLTLLAAYGAILTKSW